MKKLKNVNEKGKTIDELRFFFRMNLRFRYKAREFYEKNAELKQVIDQIKTGFFSPENPELFLDVVDSLLGENGDQYVYFH